MHYVPCRNHNVSFEHIFIKYYLQVCNTRTRLCRCTRPHFRGQRWMTAALALAACSLERGSLPELGASLDAGKTQRPSCLSALRSLASCHPLPLHLHHSPGVTGSHRNTRLLGAVVMVLTQKGLFPPRHLPTALK